MSPTNPSIGFIGLGVMGFPMASNLVEKMPDSAFYIFDVSKDAMAKTSSKSTAIHTCQNSREVADKADILLTMVPEGSHVRAVYLSPDTGILAANLDSKLIIECSTIDAATFLHVRDQILQKYPSTFFYDAPVSGGEIGAYRASLTVMLGCADEDPNLPRLKDLLSKFGKSIYPCGGPSLGLIAKQCNNYCSALITIANCEAFNIAMKSGMDPRVFNNILKTSTAGNRNAEVMNPVPGLSPDAPPSKGYRGGFRVQMMVKDIGLAIDQAKSVGANLALGEAGLSLYAAASEDPKCRDLDSKVVFRYLGGNEDWEKKGQENGK